MIKLGKAIDQAERIPEIPTKRRFNGRLDSFVYDEESGRIRVQIKIFGDPEYDGRYAMDSFAVPCEEMQHEIGKDGRSRFEQALDFVRIFMQGFNLDTNVSELPETEAEAYEMGWIGAECTFETVQSKAKDSDNVYTNVRYFDNKGKRIR